MTKAKWTMINKKNIKYQRNITSYLSELTLLANKNVNESDILDIIEVDDVRQKSFGLNDFEISKFRILFDDRVTEKFKNFIDTLYQANDNEVYIWTKRTEICGLYKVESIKNINLNFPFKVNHEGILVFLSTDFKDKLLLDFSLDSNGEKMLEVETQGQNWSAINYNL
jgi:hypothetical protein